MNDDNFLQYLSDFNEDELLEILETFDLSDRDYYEVALELRARTARNNISTSRLDTFWQMQLDIADSIVNEETLGDTENMRQQVRSEVRQYVMDTGLILYESSALTDELFSLTETINATRDTVAMEWGAR